MKIIGVVHLIKFYDGKNRKYLEISKIKYLVLLKYGTKYQKVGRNTNLIYFFINIFHRSMATKKFKVKYAIVVILCVG